MKAFRDHLRADENVDLAGAESVKGFAIGVLARHRIGIHSPHGRVWKKLSDVRLDLLGAEPGINERVLRTRRAFLRHSGGMTAQMTGQARDPAMKCQGDAAIRAIARLAAVAAEKRSGKTAPVQEQDRLLALLEPRRDCGAQFFGKNR